MEAPSPFAAPRVEEPDDPTALVFKAPRNGVIGALYATIPASLLGMVSGFSENAILTVANGLFQLSTSLVCAVLWGMWMVRAAANLRPLEPYVSFEFSPGWAFGYFFVPFLNLVRPLAAAKEIWAYSIPADVDLDLNPSSINLWWGFWIGSNILSNISSRMEPSAAGGAVTLVTEGLSIAAALIAIQWIRALNQNQVLKSQALGLRVQG